MQQRFQEDALSRFLLLGMQQNGLQTDFEIRDRWVWQFQIWTSILSTLLHSSWRTLSRPSTFATIIYKLPCSVPSRIELNSIPDPKQTSFILSLSFLSLIRLPLLQQLNVNHSHRNACFPNWNWIKSPFRCLFSAVLQASCNRVVPILPWIAKPTLNYHLQLQLSVLPLPAEIILTESEGPASQEFAEYLPT